MSQTRLVTAADFAGDCPIPLDLLARLTRAGVEAAPRLLDAVPEATRAQLAVWLYGRSHTHEIGVRVAGTCSSTSLDRTAGPLGRVLHDLSRRPYAAPSHGTIRSNARRVSLGGRSATTAAA